MVVDLNQVRQQKQDMELRQDIERLSNELGVPNIYDTWQTFQALTKATFDDMHLSKQDYIKEHQSGWRCLGELYKTDRIKAGLSRYEVARGLFISPARLKRFEDGEPVRDAKLLARCYSLHLQSLEDGE